MDCQAKVLEFHDAETSKYTILCHRWINTMTLRTWLILKKWIRQNEIKFTGALGIS